MKALATRSDRPEIPALIHAIVWTPYVATRFIALQIAGDTLPAPAWAVLVGGWLLGWLVWMAPWLFVMRRAARAHAGWVSERRWATILALGFALPSGLVLAVEFGALRAFG